MIATTPTPPPARDVLHHGLPEHEVVLLLETDPERGLTAAEVARRHQIYGPNQLPRAKTAGPFVRLLRQIHNPLVYVLLAAGGIALMLGESVDAIVIFGVVLANTVIGFVQESKAEASLEALRAMTRTEARVIRAGLERRVPSSELVPGDLVSIEAGDKVPADLRLLRGTELRVDESALTGESLPTAKDPVVLPHGTPVADRSNMLYSGTLITAGSGRGVAVATGVETELGEIHRLVGAAEGLATPLTVKLARFSRLLTGIILGLAGVTFAIGVTRGETVPEMFTAAVALAVGAIPEGLPAAVTITLAIGVVRMARRRAVIRRLPAVETLGSTTVICTDKTGTLTENQLTVRAIATPDARYSVSGSGYAADGEILDADTRAVSSEADAALRWNLLAGAICNDAGLSTDGAGRVELVGDPTEGAMLVAAGKAGIDLDVVAAGLPRTASVPFSSERRYMATIHHDRDLGTDLVLVKGAVEGLLAMCDSELDATGALRALDRAAALAAASELAASGLRVLATAIGPRCADFDTDSPPTDLVFTGLQGMLDPPRPAVLAAVRSCRTAGIAVKMITGDHLETARSIAARVGILDDARAGMAVTGAGLGELSPEEYADTVDRAAVFARVSPGQKLRLVEALQARQHVVAMTGDGVNDAPALRQADIGIAMGRGGTEVAKDAADMVLTDDDFATIEAATEEGRGVFDNLTKFIVWTLPTNMGEGLVILVAILLGTALPILPTQILWINMTTAVLLGLMLAFEPKEPEIMRRQPRDPRRPLLTGGLIVRILLVSALLVAGAWTLFEWELAGGGTLAEARTAAINVFVAVELFYLFSCRSLTRSMWSIGVFTNRWILGGVALQLVGQAAITYLPAMNSLFHTAPIGPDSWMRILGVAAVASLVVAADKRWRRQVL